MSATPVGRLERIFRLYQTPSGKKLVRYTMVSVVSTAVSLGVLGIIFGLVHLWSEVPSAIFANAVATIPSYYLNRRWAWGKTGRSHMLKEVAPFWLASFAGLALSTAAAAVAHNFSDAHNFHHFGRTVIVLGANLAAYGVLWIGKFLLFNRLFRHHHAALVTTGGEASLVASGREGAAVNREGEATLVTTGRESVAEVDELEGNPEVPVLEGLDHGL